LGYAVTDKYKIYAAQLLEFYESSGSFVIDEIAAPITTDDKKVFKNIDGIKYLNHSGGCGGTRQDAATLSKLLAAYADHANVAGITILSLGCQHLQVANLLEDTKQRNSLFDKPLLVFDCKSQLY